jgi:hypothetical protein
MEEQANREVLSELSPVVIPSETSTEPEAHYESTRSEPPSEPSSEPSKRRTRAGRANVLTERARENLQ